MTTIIVSDPTLRDGNHAVAHQISLAQTARYCQLANDAGFPIVEVGHGNGIGASTMLLGETAHTDSELLETARSELTRSQLGVHLIPGFATIQRDLVPALDIGVDVVRVATHCTEADTSQRYIEFARTRGATAYGVLMMSHMAELKLLLRQARLMQSFGADAIIIMDSAGHYLPNKVSERISTLVANLEVSVGFHAHNNLGLAIANSIAAVEAGAVIVDGTIRGFGAGSGNTPIEILIAVLNRMGYNTGIDLYKTLDIADIAERELLKTKPRVSTIGIVSALAGVFSGFRLPVQEISTKLAVDPRDLLFELGRRKLLAGQEDQIFEIAKELAKNSKLATENRPSTRS